MSTHLDMLCAGAELVHAVRSMVEAGYAQDRELLTIAAQQLLQPRAGGPPTARVHSLSSSEIATIAHALAGAQRKPALTTELLHALAVRMASIPIEAVTASDAHVLVTSCHALLKVRDWAVTHAMSVLAPVFTAALRASAQRRSSSDAQGSDAAEGLDWGALAGAYAEHGLVDASAELESAYTLAMDSVFSAMRSVRAAELTDAGLATVSCAWAQYDVRTHNSKVTRTRTAQHRPASEQRSSNIIGEYAHGAQETHISRAHVLRSLAEEVLLRGQEMGLGCFIDSLWGCTMHTQPMDVRVCMVLTEMAVYRSTAPSTDDTPAALQPTTSSSTTSSRAWGDVTDTTPTPPTPPPPTTTSWADDGAYADDTASPPLATCTRSYSEATKLTSAPAPSNSGLRDTLPQHSTATQDNEHGPQRTGVGMLSGEHLARLAEALAQLQLRLYLGHREATQILLTQPPRNVPSGSRRRPQRQGDHHRLPGRYATADLMRLMGDIHDMFSDGSVSVTRVQKKRIRLAMNKLESLG